MFPRDGCVDEGLRKCGISKAVPERRKPAGHLNELRKDAFHNV